MAMSPGLQKEYAMNDSESDKLPAHETSEIAADLENLHQGVSIMQTNVSPEILEDVSDTIVVEHAVIGEARTSAVEDVTQTGSFSIVPVHTNMAEDVTVDGSNLDITKDTPVFDSAPGGMDSPYEMHPQFDIDVQDEPMTDTILDDGDERFVFPALDGESAMDSWQTSHDVSMEEERFANLYLEQHGKRSSSLTCLGTTRSSEVNADVFGDNAVVQNIAVEAPLEWVENQTKLTNAFDNASIPQFNLDQHGNHPATDVGNIDNFNNTDSIAETIQGSVEAAMVHSQLGILEKDDVDVIMQHNEDLVADVEPPSQSCVAKEEIVQDAAEQDGIIAHNVEVESANVASTIEVHSVDFKQFEAKSDDQLPFLDGKVAREICGGNPLIANEEELVEALAEQVEQGRANEQVEESTKGCQEIVHECYAWEEDDREMKKHSEVITNDEIEGPSREELELDKEARMQVEEPAREGGAGPHNVQQELVKPCSEQEDVEKQEEKQHVMSSRNAAELGTPATLMVEHVHAGHHLDEEKKEEENDLENAERPAENEEPSDSFMKDETLPENHVEKLDGDKVRKEISLGKHKGDIPNAEENGEGDKGAIGKSPGTVDAVEKRSRKKRNKAHKEVFVFGVGDMVWAKVRSHPWWPAQIFDPADASKAAKEVEKPGRALVAFYGDCTFAWLEHSQMIAFRSNFEEKVAQTTMRSFCIAVGEALEEFCRRSELALHCEHYKGPPLHRSTGTFPDANTGIQEGVRLEDYTDMSTNICMFRPKEVLEFVKGVARSPLASWSSTLSLSELRGHAYGVRTCMVASGADEGATLLLTTIHKVKRSYTSVKDEKEPVVEVGKLAKKAKLGKSRPSEGEGECGSSSSLSKVRRYTMGGEPATPTRTAFHHLPQYSDGKVLGTRRMKKHFVVSEKGLWCDSGQKAKAMEDVPMRKDDYSKDSAERETSKKLIKVGDSIKKVAGMLTGMAPAKHAGELSAKNLKPLHKKQVRGLHSKLLASPEKKQKAKFEKSKGDVVAMDSSEKAGGAGSKADKPQRRGNQVDGAKARPHWQKSQKSHVQELALAARKRKSELEHEGAIPKVRKVSILLRGQHVAKTPSKVREEKPSDHRSSFENNYSKLQERKGSDECFDDEKLSSHLPLGLFMRFPRDFRLPSESQLEAMFLPFGPLQKFSTKLHKGSSSAQVVFKRGRDAESALKHARKNALFGPLAVTYRLCCLQHSVRTDSKMKGTPSGKASMVSERKLSFVEEKGAPPSSEEENTQDVEVGASVPIPSDGAADMPTSDIQDKMMNLLRQVSVIVNPSSSEDGS